MDASAVAQVEALVESADEGTVPAEVDRLIDEMRRLEEAMIAVKNSSIRSSMCIFEIYSHLCDRHNWLLNRAYHLCRGRKQ